MMGVEEPSGDQDPWKDPRHRSELDLWLIRLKERVTRRLRRPRNGGLRRRRRWHESLPWAILLVMGVWLASGFGMLPPGDVALFYVLGQPAGRAVSGNYWNWPSPLGHVRVLDLTAPHSHFVTFRTLTADDRPVVVTARYVWKITHPEAYQRFATHPALWLRGLILSRLGDWIRQEPDSLRSARHPDRSVVPPPSTSFRKAINRSLGQIHAGLRLVELTASLAPPGGVRQAMRAWLTLRAQERQAVAKARSAFKRSYAAQQLAEQHKRLAIEIRTRRWIERARLQTARFLSILSAYRLHPVLVRQWLVGSFLRKLKRTPRIAGFPKAGALLQPRAKASTRKRKPVARMHPGREHPEAEQGVSP